MKKFLSLFLSAALAAVMVLSLASCGGDTPDTSAEPTEKPAESVEPTATPTPAPTKTPRPKPTPRPTPTPSPFPYTEYTSLTDKVDKASIAGSKGFDNEGTENIFDNNIKTKWCVKPGAGDKDGSVTVTWKMTEPVTVTAYAFTTANDSPERNPKAWTLYGSASAEGEWTEISTVADAKLPKELFMASDVFTVEKPAEYQFYKLVVTDNFVNREIYQFSELNLLGAK